MSCFVGNTVFTIEGVKEKFPDQQRHLLIKVAEAMERVELCEHCYPKLGEEMSLFFEGTTIKINLKHNQIFVRKNAHPPEPTSKKDLVK